MKIKFLIIISFLLIFWGPPTAASQLKVRSVYSGPSGDITIVVDTSGISETPALNESNFMLLEDEKTTVSAASIVPFRDSGWKLALVLCVDVSGSVTGKPLEETKGALTNFFKKKPLKSQDRIALIAFENRPRTIQWFGNQEEILEKIKPLAWLHGQNTVLYDALYKSLELHENLPAASPELKRILVISDCNDETSEKKLNDVEDKALALHIAIDVVARVRKDHVQEDLEQGYVQDMKGLAVKTGGQFEHAEPGGVNDAITRIFRGIMATPVVNFSRKIAAEGQKTKKVGVQLQLSGPGKLLLRDSIPAKISRSSFPEQKTPVASIQDVEPDPANKTWYEWIPPPVKGLLLAFLALMVIASIILIGQRLKPKPSEVEPDAPDTEPPQTDTSSEPEPLDRTKVGGYHFPVPEPGQPAAILIGVSGFLEKEAFSVERKTFHIGAGPENDLCIVKDEYVSENHAYLRYESGRLFIHDNGSKNGTFVNQTEVAESEFLLSPGDEIRVGMSKFEVVKAPN